MRGLTCLLNGWFELLVGRVTWLANPLAATGVALLIFRRHTGAMAFSAASVVLAMVYLLFPPGAPDHRDVPRVGAWLWLGSFIALTSGITIRRQCRV